MSNSNRFTPSTPTGDIIADWNLPQEDIQHLVRAFREWNDHALFAEADVDRTKNLFCSVFNLGTDTLLEGMTTEDALVMNAPTPTDTVYAMMVDTDDRLAFVRLRFRLWGLFAEYRLTSFELMCTIAHQGDPIEDDELDMIRAELAEE